MKDLTSKEHIDHLAVLLSGVGVEQLLGVPQLPSEAGEAQASAVIASLDEWGIIDRVAAKCFDTTASNTGINSGACTIIEQKLRRDLLFLRCCHHIIELVVGLHSRRQVVHLVAMKFFSINLRSTGSTLIVKIFNQHQQTI
jgi:hypothetical protein